MSGGRKAFPRVPRKYWPKGIAILHEDHDILVIDKAGGLLTVSTEQEREKTAYFLLTDYVRRGNSKSRNRIFIVHRLDRETSGVLVFAKSEAAKLTLQENWHRFSKCYHAVLQGSLEQKEGTIESYLAENRAFRVYSVTDPGTGKLARTGYRVLRESGGRSLVVVDLLTGRKHQIRVHFAEQGCPVVGDGRYGVKTRGAKRLALHASSLTIVHPVTQEEMRFEAELPAELEKLVRKGSRGTPMPDPAKEA